MTTDVDADVGLIQRVMKPRQGHRGVWAMPFASLFLISEQLHGENKTPAASFAGFLTGIISFSSPEPEECGYYGIVIQVFQCLERSKDKIISAQIQELHI